MRLRRAVVRYDVFSGGVPCRFRFVGLCVLLSWTHLAEGAKSPPPAYALQNARIVTMAGPIIDSGMLVMRDGRIAAVGADVTAPVDAIVIDASGWTLYPGFIDAHSSVGIPDAPKESAKEASDRRERGEPTPGLRAETRASSLYRQDAKALKLSVRPVLPSLPSLRRTAFSEVKAW